MFRTKCLVAALAGGWAGGLGSAAAGQEPGPREIEINAALERARPRLRAHAAKADLGPLALLCLAMLHDGVPSTDRVFADALGRLARTQLDGTYELALRLMVMQDHPAWPDRDRAAARDLKRLLRNQSNGGFGYGAGSGWDLSNTQYGALGLRAAAALGVPPPAASWRSLAAAVAQAQHRDGGFGYTSGSSNPYPSMTVAGIGVLEICRQHLASESPPLQRGIAAGWAWMERHRSALGDPQAQWSFYFHYGVERAAILSGVELVGGVDWYEAGARMLLAQQLPCGGWGRAVIRGTPPAGAADDPIQTAFAVLFLRRKFGRAVAGPITPGHGYLTKGLPPEASAEEIARAVEIDVRRGDSAVPELLIALRSPILARRKAALLSLHKISGRSFGYHPYHAPQDSADAIKAAELWWLTRQRQR